MLKRPTPDALAENAGIAFPGAHVSPGLVMGPSEAKRMLAARNSHGKPNADVLRPYRDADDLRSFDWVRATVSTPTKSLSLPNGLKAPSLSRGACPQDALRETRPSGRVEGNATHLGETDFRWIVDFPADMTPGEAALYEQPWRLWVEAGGVLHARADPMRIAISRIEWFLAAPSRLVPHGFARLETPALPGAGLVVVATDDDFVAAVLGSGVFNAWVHAHGGRLRVWHVASFPFPWPPRTELGALTREQLELRDKVIRASDDDHAVSAAYGWHDIADEADLVSHLRAAHHSSRSIG